MSSLKTIAIAAAAALVALGSSTYAQVTDYKDIKTGTLRTFSMPQPKRIQLGNGLVIFLQEDHELPLIRGSATIRGGSRDVPAPKTGLAAIYAMSWRTGGTETKTGDQLDETLESRAARVETSGDSDSASLRLDVLKGDFDTVFPIFAELLQKPAFRQDKIDLAKTQARTGISRRNDEPGSIAAREGAKLGYGADSPYARQPEYATINAITRDDLLAFHKQFVHPNNIIFGLIGDFDSAAMEKKVRAAFGSWSKGPMAPAMPATGPSAKPGVYFVQKDDVTQATIAVLHAGAPLRKDPDYYAIVVMNEILSGGFSGRLMNNIRSKAGLAYGVGGGLGAGWDHPMLFNVSMGTKSGSTAQAISLLRQEVSDLQAKPFTAEELSHAKDSILNAYVFTMDTPAKVLNQRAQLEFYGYPADYYQKYQSGIEKVTAADVERVAKKYIHPDQLAVLVVGNQKDFDKPLSTLGTVTPIDVTIPEPGAPAKPAAAAAAAAAPAAATTSTPEALALVKKVQDFVGGKAKLDSVLALKNVSTRTIKTPQGDIEAEVETIVQYPGSVRQTLKTPMGEMVSVITPTAGFAMTPMGTQEIPASQRGEVKLDVVSILKSADKPGYVFTVSGSEKAGDVQAQVLSINADGVSTRWTVDPATGKILRTARQGRMGEQITEYTAWQSSSGLNLPSASTTTAGGEVVSKGTVKSIELNPAVDPKSFEKPAP